MGRHLRGAPWRGDPCGLEPNVYGILPFSGGRGHDNRPRCASWRRLLGLGQDRRYVRPWDSFEGFAGDDVGAAQKRPLDEKITVALLSFMLPSESRTTFPATGQDDFAEIQDNFVTLAVCFQCGSLDHFQVGNLESVSMINRARQGLGPCGATARVTDKRFKEERVEGHEVWYIRTVAVKVDEWTVTRSLY